MRRNYGYLELSPRGFANEIQYIAACKSCEEMTELQNKYRNPQNGNVAWRIKAKEVKGRFVVDAQRILKMLDLTGYERDRLEEEIYNESQDYYYNKQIK